MNATKNLALASILSALGTVALVTATQIPTVRQWLMWLVAITVYIITRQTSRKFGALSVLSIAFLTFAMTGNLVAISQFVLFYGPYAVLKTLFDNLKGSWMRFTLKSIFFIIANALISYFAFLFFGALNAYEFFQNHRIFFVPVFLSLFLFLGFYADWLLGYAYQVFLKRVRPTRVIEATN